MYTPLQPGFWFQSALNIWAPNFLLVAALIIIPLRRVLGRIPAEQEDAAILDGCGFWRSLGHLVLPRLGPVLLVVALALILAGWEDAVAPGILMFSPVHASIVPDATGNGFSAFAAVTYSPSRIFGLPSGPGVAVLMVLISPLIGLVYLAQRYLRHGRLTQPGSPGL